MYENNYGRQISRSVRFCLWKYPSCSLRKYVFFYNDSSASAAYLHDMAGMVRSRIADVCRWLELEFTVKKKTTIIRKISGPVIGDVESPFYFSALDGFTSMSR